MSSNDVPEQSPIGVPKQRIFLAGTISFPDAFPRLGEMWIDSLMSDLLPSSPITILKVEEKHECWTVVRSFLLDDVSAIFIPANSRQPDCDEATWLVGPEIMHDNFQTFFDGAQQDPPLPDGKKAGILYVPENARVHMLVDTAMPAAESRDFRPPMIEMMTCNPCG